ncbi:glycosyltransferase family 2 protein [Aestuariimicrobium ganziense]|uniref:glycosyltransferase family 2 protein n=1 Tax=Aestuariimicrobium ganziense TaxID=2773677 RepID=UPI001942BA38|nr:glycosyltransferase family 2 protein [Aestuariimicrobium ganziense]
MSAMTTPVSVIMPVLNEQTHLATSVQGVLDQHYAGDLEIVLAVGPSTDRTREIADELAADDPRIRVVDNPSGTTPDALNLAIAATRHPIVVRVDAHGELAPDYITTAVELLERTGAANVGGLMDAQGTTAFQQAVAIAYTSRLGLGGGAFHLHDTPEGAADSVFLGVFRRDALVAVGGYDPDLLRAQDWELNLRLRQAGEQVWFSPALRVVYRPRSSVKALAKQFFRTGQWRREVIRRHPESASLRYLAPPALVGGLAVGKLAGLVGLVPRTPRWLLLGWLVPLGYLLGVVAGAAAMPRQMPAAVRARLPFVLAVMHLAWGSGFVVGLREDERHRRDAAPRPAAQA